MTVASVETTDSLGFDKYEQESTKLDFSVPMLGPEHFKEIEKCNGFDAQDSKRHYDHVAMNYEGIYDRLGYPDPTKVAENAEEQAEARGLDKETCRVLDLGCGTGLVG